MDISKHCMIINIQVGTWLAHKRDKDATRKAVRSAKAADDALSVNKHLVPKEDMKDISAASSAARTHFYEKTLPWKDNGDRLLVRSFYEKFIERHAELRAEFDAAADKFVKTKYPAIRDKAQFRMGETFNANDYPTPREVRSKFYIKLDIDAITDASDFRVGLSKEQLASVRKEITGAMEERITRALGGVWDRLEDTLGHFTERMKSDAKFKIATIDNLRELVDELPALNFTGNAELKKIGDRIKAKLFEFDAKELREDPKARKRVAKEAADIMDDMAGFMKAFGK
jgi:hypothetical protein